jgi:signal peptide peptidase SppA, 36K type
LKSKGFWLLIGSVLFFGFSMFLLFLAAFWMLGEDEGIFAARGDLAVVEINGPIFESKEILEQLDRVYKNDHVKGLILRIDSPGGAVGSSQEIYQGVLRVREKKKVIASMGTVAASGGYYIAVGADKIVANPGTITGSIGVLMDHTNVEELLKFLKVHAEILKSGRLKDSGSPLRPMTPEERQLLQGILEDMHRQFKEAVAKGRNLKLEKVDEIADGRIFTGDQALKLGLVDEMGNQQKAVDIAVEMLGIKGEPKLLYPKKKKVDIFELLATGESEVWFKKIFYSLREARVLYWIKGMSL